ncbi:hypothetical protein [Glaciibacter flavus]|uniref:hypothetical protein n=1 Tax=Orlajensenia flava TaxID=2565934 RepID=UPI003AFFFDE2
MNLADLFWNSIEFLFLAGVVVLAAVGNRLSLDARASAIQRRDPGTASALRQAQAMSDYAYGIAAWMPEVIIVCTPSRRAALASDDDLAFATRTPAHPQRPAGRHEPAPRRVYVISNRVISNRVISSRVSRTAPATRLRRADTRRRRQRRESRAR